MMAMMSILVPWLLVLLSVSSSAQVRSGMELHEMTRVQIKEAADTPILDPYHIECRGDTLLISDMKTGTVHLADGRTGEVLLVLQPSMEMLIDSIRPRLAGRYDSVIFYSLGEYAMMTRQTKEDLMASPMIRPKYFVGRFLNDDTVDILTGNYVPAFRSDTVPQYWPVVSIVRYSLHKKKVLHVRPLMSANMTSWPMSDAFLPFDSAAIVGVEDSKAMRAGVQASIPLFARFDSKGGHSTEYVPIDVWQMSTLGYGLTMTQPFELKDGAILYTYAAVPRGVIFTRKLADYRTISFDDIIQHIPDGRILLDSLRSLRNGVGRNNAGKNPYVCTGFVPVDDYCVAVIRDWRTKKGDTVTSYIAVGSLEDSSISFRSMTRFDNLDYQPWRVFSITERGNRNLFGAIGRNARSGDWVVTTFRVGE